MNVAQLESSIRTIPDFPKPGIQFKDITPLLADPSAWKASIDWMQQILEKSKPDKIAAIESRGFIFASALAYNLGVGFVPIRKPGKLPFETHSVKYELEYGFDVLEIHTDAVQKGDQVAIVDDLLATGGTASAAVELVRKSGAEIVDFLFLIHLAFLGGKEKLRQAGLHSEKIHALIEYK